MSDQNNSFRELMNKNSDCLLATVRGSIRSNVNQQKRARLKKAVGKQLAERTLLDSHVSKKHAERLAKKFYSRWADFDHEKASERLRFMTILHSVCALDKNVILSEIEGLKDRLRNVVLSVKGIEVLGAFEVEIINMRLMRQHASGMKDGEEARKLRVLEQLRKDQFIDADTDSLALVHYHGMIDLAANGDGKLKTLRDCCKAMWRGSYQVRFDTLFKTKSVKKNLTDIAAYMVKGGNESLNYKFRFGRDDASDTLDRKMLKSGTKKMGADFEGLENIYSLTDPEMLVLASTLDDLMGANNSTMRNGYLWKYGDQIRHLA
jgi:hypothetical protein